MRTLFAQKIMEIPKMIKSQNQECTYGEFEIDISKCVFSMSQFYLNIFDFF